MLDRPASRAGRAEPVAAVVARWQRRYKRRGLLGKRRKPKQTKGAAGA
jgi:hypothetical protein